MTDDQATGDRRPATDTAPGWAVEILGAIGEARLVEVRDALLKDAVALDDRDAVLLHRAAGALLRELVPEGGPADAVTAYGSLLHLLLLAWHTAWVTKVVTAADLPTLVSSVRSLPAVPSSSVPSVIWVQLPERKVWSQPFAGAAHEPVNGIFVHQWKDHLRVLAILGQHPARDGFTTLETDAALPLAPPPARADGSAPFASVIPGGDRAGLLSLTSAHELAAFAALVSVAGDAGRG